MTQIKKKKLYEEVIIGIEEMLKSNNMQPETDCNRKKSCRSISA